MTDSQGVSTDPKNAQRNSSTTTRLLAQNGTKRDRVAILLADGSLSDEAIAKDIGIGRRTIGRWKQDPDFAALVGDYRGKIIAAALQLPIAKKHERIRTLDDLHTRTLAVIEERAKRHAADIGDPDSPVNATRLVFGHSTPAEAATGLMVRKETANTTGMVTVNWEFDRALVSTIADIEKQAAQELGQWEETLNLHHDGLVEQEYVVVTEVPWAVDTDETGVGR